MNQNLEGLLNVILKKIEESRQHDPFLSRWKYKLPESAKSMSRKTKDDVITFFANHELVASFKNETLKTYDMRNEEYTSTQAWLIVEYEDFHSNDDPQKRQHNIPFRSIYTIK